MKKWNLSLEEFKNFKKVLEKIKTTDVNNNFISILKEFSYEELMILTYCVAYDETGKKEFINYVREFAGLKDDEFVEFVKNKDTHYSKLFIDFMKYNNLYSLFHTSLNDFYYYIEEKEPFYREQEKKLNVISVIKNPTPFNFFGKTFFFGESSVEDKRYINCSYVEQKDVSLIFGLFNFYVFDNLTTQVQKKKEKKIYKNQLSIRLYELVEEKINSKVLKSDLINTISIIEDSLSDIEHELNNIQKDETTFNLDLSSQKEKLNQKKIAQENHLKNLFNEIYSIQSSEDDNTIEEIISQNLKYIQAIKKRGGTK